MKTPVVCRRWAVFGLLAPLIAQAQLPAAEPTATGWTGVDVVNGRPSSVRVQPQPAGRTARSTTPPPEVLKIAFGKPRLCQVEARRVGGSAQQRRYDVTASNGGIACNAWIPGQAVLDVDGTQARLQLAGSSDEINVALWAKGTAPATVTVPATLGGAWTSDVTSRVGKPIALRLQLKGSDPGDDGSELAYGSPRNCRVPLRYEGSTAAGAWYAVLPGNGGAFCDTLLDSWLVVQPAEGQASVRFEPLHPECAPSCALARSQP